MTCVAPASKRAFAAASPRASPAVWRTRNSSTPSATRPALPPRTPAPSQSTATMNFICGFCPSDTSCATLVPSSLRIQRRRPLAEGNCPASHLPLSATGARCRMFFLFAALSGRRPNEPTRWQFPLLRVPLASHSHIEVGSGLDTRRHSVMRTALATACALTIWLTAPRAIAADRPPPPRARSSSTSPPTGALFTSGGRRSWRPAPV